MQLTILYQDQHLIAIDKPSGLLVHRSMIAKRETQFAMQMLRDQIGQHVFPVHRLDRPTSGVLLFALDRKTAALLTEQFAHRQIQKGYHAMLRGFVNQRWSIDYPLRELHDKMTDQRANQDKPAQPAQTELTCLQRFSIPLPVGRYQGARFSYVSLQPLTGRKHQLRRHMAHIRHPIIGDTTHGDGKQNKFLRHHFNFHHLALTCSYMRIIHPHSQQPIELNAPLSELFQQLLNNWQVFSVTADEHLNNHKQTINE